ncbi:Esterase/lipase/thioesterase [Tulasnella sp. JGI-2019a]|nr:Esterase/lipase/thioesterase [Tulasnella sp. JGI-2019a]
MKSFTATVLAICSVVTTVSAHGYVQGMSIGSQKYDGFLPFTDNYASPLVNTKITRHVPDDGPVLDWTSKDLMCNVGAEDAQWRTTHTAAVDAGSDMSFTWNTWPADHLGPVTTYMANCGGNCTDFDGTGNVWFKIDELGLVSGNTYTGVWASLLLGQHGATWTVTIPAGLTPGNYLIRHEILALHAAHAPQFYPSCAQLVVSGSGTSSPSSDELVAIPGIYSDNLSTQIDIWTNPASSYPIAGPPVAKLQSYTNTNAKNLGSANVTAPATSAAPADAAASGTSSDSAVPTTAATSTTSAAAADPTSNNTASGAPLKASTGSSGNGKSCRVKKRSTYAKRHVANANKKRRLEGS